MDEKTLRRRIERVQKGWTEDQRYLREHGITAIVSAQCLAFLRERSTVKIPRFRGFTLGRKPARSPISLGYDQHDMFFDYASYLRDHQES